MAALGLEVAQYNAAYILSRLHCPAVMKEPSSSGGGGVKGGDQGYNHRVVEGEEREGEVSHFVVICYSSVV